jgi:hypothetical protein
MINLYSFIIFYRYPMRILETPNPSQPLVDRLLAFTWAQFCSVTHLNFSTFFKLWLILYFFDFFIITNSSVMQFEVWKRSLFKLLIEDFLFNFYKSIFITHFNFNFEDVLFSLISISCSFCSLLISMIDDSFLSLIFRPLLTQCYFQKELIKIGLSVLSQK